MARSSLINPVDDLMSDSGSVLWSFIKGEQLEFPVTLNFLLDATAGYTYEAIVVEALNVAQQTEKPIDIQPNGVVTNLTIRVPTFRGVWSSSAAYNREDIVKYDGKYYKLLAGFSRVDATLPNLDPFWTETLLNKIYLQFPKTLGSTWNIQPTVGYPVYGFFELRVTEPIDSVYRKTWKPVRGMVQILFSPTYSVDD